ncbi:MAG: 16S rRNA (guanine(527)-N(7))-methyltransferase RsmG [Steroidobacterales bacterium]
MPKAQHAELEAQQLIADAAALDVTLRLEQAQRLLQLLDELAIWNKTYNLTAITERAAAIKEHLLDSLSAHAELAGDRIADVGTGAGFPGLPLAIADPLRHFTLIDATAKKIRFVAHAVRTLALENVAPLHVRAELLSVSEPFDTVIARAVAPLPRLLATVAGLCGPSSRVVALKGRFPREEIALLPRGWRVTQTRTVAVPGLGAERHLLTIVPDARAPVGG